MKKILILSAPLGAGHGAAAKAIEGALALNYPEIEVKSIDVLDFVSDVFRKGLPRAFVYFNSKIPFLYKWIYMYYNNKSRRGSLNDISNLILKKSRFVNFIKEFNPDFIIATNPLPMQLVSKTKEKNIINIPSGNVCTDFGFHAFWHNADINYYFVANEDIKKSLIEHEVEPDAVRVTGIPISLKFSGAVDREKVISGLGFDTSRPILLIVGGKAKYQKLLAIVDGIKEENKNLQFIIVAGRDKVLQKKLKNSKIGADASVRVFDFVSNLEEFMTVADLILTKAGGLTVSECLAKNLPMIIDDIIPGQEEDNADYVVNHEVGVRVKNVKETIEVITELFLDKEKLTIMKNRCKKIAKPNAAKDLVDFVVSKIK